MTRYVMDAKIRVFCPKMFLLLILLNTREGQRSYFRMLEPPRVIRVETLYLGGGGAQDINQTLNILTDRHIGYMIIDGPTLLQRIHG